MNHSVAISLEDVERAFEARAAATPELFTQLVLQEESFEDFDAKDSTPSFTRYWVRTHSYEHLRKPVEEQQQIRRDLLDELETAAQRGELHDRYRVHEFLMRLAEDKTPTARRLLLQIVENTPLVYGPWKGLKQLLKHAEATDDHELFGALAARFDTAYAKGGDGHCVSQRTLGYLSRRAWRKLRRVAEQLPAQFPDFAVKVLAAYPDVPRSVWQRSWIVNHLFFHETGKYSARMFPPLGEKSLVSHRAYGELWRRSPRPLFDLLLTARAEFARQFAISALKSDFRTALREVEPQWAARLVDVGSITIDRFFIWLMNNVPRFEQTSFRDLGLHDAVLTLFDSPLREARTYAVDYARTCARDLPVSRLIQLMQNDLPAVRKLAQQLLQERNARRDVGLDGWGQLLETEGGHQLAADMLRKHFGRAELTSEWLADRLLSANDRCSAFARNELPKLHSARSLGVDFFLELLDRAANGDENLLRQRQVTQFVFGQLHELKLEQFETDILRRLLLNPLSFGEMNDLLERGRIEPTQLGIDFLRALAFPQDFEQNAWITDFRRSGPAWAQELKEPSRYVTHALRWLTDARRVDPRELDRDWLLDLVVRPEKHYQEFACELLVKAFPPADFAPVDSAAESKKANGPQSATEKPTVDLAGQSFLFTGKMATMPRSEAQKQVRSAGGAVASTVSKNLTYLVIGDEGSPLYGEGRKGSKQTKAESLIEAGAELKIISETAFLRMLAGESQVVSADAAAAGCDTLWNLATAEGPADTPLKKFALRYLRLHHPEICLKETDRPVDPGEELPESWLTFEQVQPLFFDRRTPLRHFAVELARYEFARWSPAMRSIIELCESPYAEVREFVALAITAEDTHEHRRYRLNPERLTADAVYGFCESKDAPTRALGMELIGRHPRLQLPQELYRLTESPDRRVRAFVVRRLWSMYRHRGVTQPWIPWKAAESNVGRKHSRRKPRDVGSGLVEIPKSAPAEPPALLSFLRQSLFSLPPGPPSREQGEPPIRKRLLPLSHGRAKLALLETLRDLAIQDREFAETIRPLLETFLQSGSSAESAACLVAITRIDEAHL